MRVVVTSKVRVLPRTLHGMKGCCSAAQMGLGWSAVCRLKDESAELDVQADLLLCSLTHTLVLSLHRFLGHSYTHSLTHSFVRSINESLTHSLIFTCQSKALIAAVGLQLTAGAQSSCGGCWIWSPSCCRLLCFLPLTLKHINCCNQICKDANKNKP